MGWLYILFTKFQYYKFIFIWKFMNYEEVFFQICIYVFMIMQTYSTLQPMDKRLSEYIKRVEAQGEHRVTSTLKMKLLLEVFVKESLFKNTAFPPKHNKRFWPSLKESSLHGEFSTQQGNLSSCLSVPFCAFFCMYDQTTKYTFINNNTCYQN